MSLNWAYGISTTPARIDDLLPQTLESLCEAGFEHPRLFVDGCDRPEIYRSFCLPVTVREPEGGATLGNFGNWWASMLELYCRNPHADRYVMFEDDILCCKNLRQYLERCQLPDGYWNLYTASQNERQVPSNYRGWFPSNQRGLGALALMFDQKAVMELLHSPHMVHHPLTSRGTRRVDGIIVTAMKATGRLEQCHYPSLIKHMGEKTTIRGNAQQPQIKSFPGEDFDCLSLLENSAA